MKVRSGFVSNSSSSSFILSKEAYPTIWDLVIHMLRIRDKDYHDEDCGGALHDIWPLVSDEQKRALEARNSGREPKAVTFPTCNFDTFIWDAGDSFWVSTCNNHPFYRDLNGQLGPNGTQTKPPKGSYDYDLPDYIELCMEDDHSYERI